MAEDNRSSSSLKNGVGSFKQQNLKGWQPVLTPVAVISILLCITIVFLPIGIILRDSSQNVIEQIERYDNIPECMVTADDTYLTLPKECHINITIEKDMEPPIYFYYELDGFYQNHRRYLKSKSDSQLRGISYDDLKPKSLRLDCDPLEFEDGTQKRLVACGLIAGSFFEDRFTMSVNGESLCPNCTNYGTNNSQAWQQNWSTWHSEPNWIKEGIAWQSDLKRKYTKKTFDSNIESRKGPRQQQTGLNLPEITDEDFVVWMRVAALPKFRKLHRKITDKTLNAGDQVVVTILNWFPVTEFGGQKKIVLAKTTWCGGKNFALAWTYIIVSCITLFLAIALAILLLFGSRKMANVDQFTWHNKPANQDNSVLIDQQR